MAAGFKLEYSAVSFVAPFFNFYQPNADKINMVAPLVSCAKFFRPNGHGPPLPVDLEKFPDHLYPWMYDFNNPF